MTAPNPDPNHIRLAKRVAEQLNCSRSTAEQFIEGGFVSVDGQLEEAPGARVRPDQAVTVAPDASLLELTPVTLLSAASHLPEDASGIRVLQRHFKQQECFTPLPTDASGLVVYTQDKRIARKLAEDIESLEQECIVEVAGEIAPNGLQRLCHGLSFNGRPLPPIKVSWQNETKLRFALKGIRPGQIPAMCEAVGLRVLGIKRIRIGRVPLAKVPEGQWRYLQPWEKF